MCLFIGKNITAGELALPESIEVAKESAPSNASNSVVAEETPTNESTSPKSMSKCLLSFCLCLQFENWLVFGAIIESRKGYSLKRFIFML